MDSQTVVPMVKVGQVPVSHTIMESKKAYFIHGLNTTYIMPNGEKAFFKVGIVPGIPKPAFVTNVEGFITELDNQIKAGHPELHTMPGYETVSEEMLDPLDSVKKQAVADYMQSDEFKKLVLQMKGTGTPEDSTTKQGDFSASVANTTGSADVAASSDGAAAGPLSLGSLK